MSQGIALIAGLGNPGPEYAETRHNAGFRFLEALRSGSGVKLRHDPRFSGDAGRLAIAGREVWLLAPQTFMNHSGEAVAAFARYYKIPPEQILVAHDDLDLLPGTVRLKVGGGDGGHNGLSDITQRLGTQEYARLRIGIGHPGDKNVVADYVLSSPPAPERELIETVIARCLEHSPLLMAGDMR